MSRALNKVANRESLTAEELAGMNTYDKETLTIFGQAIDGVREMTRLGFTPLEQTYQSLASVINFDKDNIAESLGNAFPGRITPLASFWLDYYYGKDTFYGGELPYQLPPRYTAVIPKAMQKALGLTLRDRPIMKMGEEVGTEKVLYGNPKIIAIIRRFPVFSRQLNDTASFIESVKEGKMGEAVARAITGVSTGKIDLEQIRSRRKRAIDQELIKAARRGGAPKPTEILHVPKQENKSDSYRRFVEVTKAAH